MAGKKVSFGAKPSSADGQTANVEQWVTNRTQEGSSTSALDAEKAKKPIKRLTLDIPETLHRSIKRSAADEGMTMVELITTMLEERFGED